MIIAMSRLRCRKKPLERRRIFFHRPFKQCVAINWIDERRLRDGLDGMCRSHEVLTHTDRLHLIETCVMLNRSLIRQFRSGIAALTAMCVLVAAPGSTSLAADSSQHDRLEAPVKAVAHMTLAIGTPAHAGALPVYANRDINHAAPDVKQVFIVIHGTLRNADTYFATGLQILAKAGDAATDVMVVSPQFLTTADVKAFQLPPQTFAWTQSGWKRGDAAREPAPVSSFSVMDTLLGHFSDRRLYPALSTVVVIGHSAGAQLVQRYAVVGREGGNGSGKLAAAGIAVRFVVANPSSYLYFDDQRPGSGSVLPASCKAATRWKYGLDSAPPYVSSQNTASLESQYAARHVVYLLGMADTDPSTHFIDRSCAAMAQGPNRLARGLAYFRYLTGRHPSGLNQQVVEVPGIGHDNLGMLTSDCGMAVLFDKPVPSSCPVVAEATRNIQSD